MLFNFEGAAFRKWGCSSAGRAPALQAGGQEFDSPHLHQSNFTKWSLRTLYEREQLYEVKFAIVSVMPALAGQWKTIFQKKIVPWKLNNVTNDDREDLNEEDILMSNPN